MRCKLLSSNTELFCSKILLAVNVILLVSFCTFDVATFFVFAGGFGGPNTYWAFWGLQFRRNSIMKCIKL